MALSEKLKGCFQILKEIKIICGDSIEELEASPGDTIMDEDSKVQTPCNKDAGKDTADLCIQRVSRRQDGSATN